MKKKNFYIIFLIAFALLNTSWSFGAVGDTSRQTKKFRAKSKKNCSKKIDRFLAMITPYSLGPDGGPDLPGECMECKEIRRKFKKISPFSGSPVICKIVGKCVVVDNSKCGATGHISGGSVEGHVSGGDSGGGGSHISGF